MLELQKAILQGQEIYIYNPQRYPVGKLYYLLPLQMGANIQKDFNYHVTILLARTQPPKQLKENCLLRGVPIVKLQWLIHCKIQQQKLQFSGFELQYGGKMQRNEIIQENLIKLKPTNQMAITQKLQFQEFQCYYGGKVQKNETKQESLIKLRQTNQISSPIKLQFSGFKQYDYERIQRNEVNQKNLKIKQKTQTSSLKEIKMNAIFQQAHQITNQSVKKKSKSFYYEQNVSEIIQIACSTFISFEEKRIAKSLFWKLNMQQIQTKYIFIEQYDFFSIYLRMPIGTLLKLKKNDIFITKLSQKCEAKQIESVFRLIKEDNRNQCQSYRGQCVSQQILYCLINEINIIDTETLIKNYQQHSVQFTQFCWQKLMILQGRAYNINILPDYEKKIWFSIVTQLGAQIKQQGKRLVCPSMHIKRQQINEQMCCLQVLRKQIIQKIVKRCCHQLKIVQ